MAYLAQKVLAKKKGASKGAAAGAGTAITGIVKSWNGAKGFGFIESPEAAGDIFFGRKELPEDAQNVQGKFLEGKEVSLTVVQDGDGKLKASSVEIIAKEGEEYAGVIKAYSNVNAYGFITCSSLPGIDIRFNRVDLDIPPHVEPNSIKGQGVVFQIKMTEDQKMRVSTVKFASQSVRAKACGSLEFGAFGKGAAGKKSQPFGLDGFNNAGQVSGVVKSFSEKNGYGFINSPGLPLDIKFGKMDCLGAVAAGQQVSFVITPGPNGIQAKMVMPVAVGFGKQMKRPLPATSAAGAPMKLQKKGGGKSRLGSIKSYNLSKGFGFITCPTVKGDIFFMRKDLPEENQTDALEPDTQVSFDLNQKPDGKLAATSVVVCG